MQKFFFLVNLLSIYLAPITMKVFIKPLKHFFSIHYQNSFINSYVYKYIYVHAHVISCILFFLITRTVACQAPLSIEYSRQKYWSQLLFPTQGDLPDPKIKTVSQVSWIGRQILYHWATWEGRIYAYLHIKLFPYYKWWNWFDKLSSHWLWS